VPVAGAPTLVLEDDDYTFDVDEGVLLDGDDDVVAEGTMREVNGSPVPMLLVTALDIRADATLTAVGEQPLYIAAFDRLLIAGDIDVGEGGAGARENCGDAGAKNGSNNASGASGGGGGGFAGTGGRGGNGNSDGALQQGGAGGLASALPEFPIGGCPGADGGNGTLPGGIGGDGGAGGGALYLFAPIIRLNGTISSGGEGGEGGSFLPGLTAQGDAGGGGGGSGGTIEIEVGQFLGDGVIAVNGGGGGGGSTNAAGGQDGESGDASLEPASGGAGITNGATAGGRGGTTLPNGFSVEGVFAGAGGGGGGAAGFIVIRAQEMSDGLRTSGKTKISPLLIE
jgi:hypothetical protein